MNVCGNLTDLYKISASSKAQWIGKMFAIFIDAIMTSKQVIIGTKHNLIDSGDINANTVIGETFGGMEIKYK